MNLSNCQSLYIQSSFNSISRLRKYVSRQNLLMNMVIHDLRSPTNSIIMGLEMVQRKIDIMKQQDKEKSMVS